MQNMISTMSFKSEFKASFVSEEFGFAKHTLFQDELIRHGVV